MGRPAEGSRAIRRQIQRGVDILREGGVVAFPTDTVYGLGASYLNGQAVERVYQVKQRSHAVALPLLLADISQIESVAAPVPRNAWLLAQRFLPGGLTIILHKAPSVPDIVTGGGPNVAVRIPDHPVPVALIRGLGVPIIGTSANLSGRPSMLSAEEVRQQLGCRIDFIIEGGRCPGGVESAVVDLTAEPPVILREGAIPRGEIEDVLA